MFFEIIVLLLKHFGIPGLFLWWLWKREYNSIIDWLVMVFLVGAYVAFIYLGGEWHWFGFYFRYILLILFISGVIKSFWQIRNKPVWVKKDARENFGFFFTIFFMFIFLGLSIWAYWGLSVHEPGIELAFPLKHGRFYIIHGGNSPMLNQHHRPFHSPLKYSIDISKLYPGGVRAKGLYPKELNRYAIYGDSVFSPSSGRVLSVTDSIPDSSPSKIDTTSSRVAGNHIVIQTGSTYILLAQLLRGSIVVSPGDTVTRGQFLARVGNSGFTTEPHLHISASRGSPRVLLEGEGVPIFFNKQFLVRNDMIDVP